MSNDYFRFVFHYLPKDFRVPVDYEEQIDETYLIPISIVQRLLKFNKTSVNTTTRRDLTNIKSMLKKEGVKFFPLTSDFPNSLNHLLAKINALEDNLKKTIDNLYQNDIKISHDRIDMIGPLRLQTSNTDAMNGYNNLKSIIQNYATVLKDKSEIELEDRSKVTAYKIHFYPQPCKRVPHERFRQFIHSGLQQKGEMNKLLSNINNQSISNQIEIPTNKQLIVENVNFENSVYYFEIFDCIQPRKINQALIIYYNSVEKKKIIIDNFIKIFTDYITRKQIKFNGKEGFKLPINICQNLDLPDNIIIMNDDDYVNLLMKLELSSINRSNKSINFKIIGNVTYKREIHIVCQIVMYGDDNDGDNDGDSSFSNVPVALNNNNRLQLFQNKQKKDRNTKYALNQNQQFLNQLQSLKIPNPNSLNKNSLIVKIPLFIQTLSNESIPLNKFLDLFPSLIRYINRLKVLEKNSNNKLSDDYLGSIQELQLKHDDISVKLLQRQEEEHQRQLQQNQIEKKNKQTNTFIQNSQLEFNKEFRKKNTRESIENYQMKKLEFNEKKVTDKSKIIQNLFAKIKTEGNEETKRKITDFASQLIGNMELNLKLKGFEDELSSESEPSSENIFLKTLISSELDTNLTANNDKKKELLKILIETSEKLQIDNKEYKIEKIKFKLHEILTYKLEFNVKVESLRKWKDINIEIDNEYIYIDSSKILRTDIILNPLKKKRRHYPKENCLNFFNKSNPSYKKTIYFLDVNEKDLFFKLHQLIYLNQGGGKKIVNKHVKTNKVGVYQTQGGYYYRRFQNGNTKRISIKEYMKRK